MRRERKKVKILLNVLNAADLLELPRRWQPKLGLFGVPFQSHAMKFTVDPLPAYLAGRVTNRQGGVEVHNDPKEGNKMSRAGWLASRDTNQDNPACQPITDDQKDSAKKGLLTGIDRQRYQRQVDQEKYFNMDQEAIERARQRGRELDGDYETAAANLRRYIEKAMKRGYGKWFDDEVKNAKDDAALMEATRVVAELAPVYKRLFRCKVCRRLEVDISGKRKRAYCSDRCISNRPDKGNMARWRRRKRIQQLATIRAMIGTCPDRGDWKAWVAPRAGVTRNWLTYAVGRGEIKPPA